MTQFDFSHLLLHAELIRLERINKTKLLQFDSQPIHRRDQRQPGLRLRELAGKVLPRFSTRTPARIEFEACMLKETQDNLADLCSNVNCGAMG